MAVGEKISHILIVHPDCESAFTFDGQNLPSFSPSSLGLDVNELNRYVKKTLDLPFEIVFLRYECDRPVPNRLPHYLIYIFEIPRSVVSSIGEYGTWVAKEKVTQLCVHPSADLVTHYLRKYAIHGLDINTDRLRSFSKRGWFDTTSAWSRSILATAGFHTDELQPSQNTGLSCILLLWSQCGVKFYVKGCYPKGIYNEAAVSLVLGTEMPDDFIKPLAVDLERNVLLMNDLGPTIDSLDGYECDAKTEERVVTAWGKIQLRTIPKKEQLIGGGVPVWDMDKYRSIYEEMFGDVD